MGSWVLGCFGPWALKFGGNVEAEWLRMHEASSSKALNPSLAIHILVLHQKRGKEACSRWQHRRRIMDVGAT